MLTASVNENAESAAGCLASLSSNMPIQTEERSGSEEEEEEQWRKTWRIFKL